MSWQKCYVKHRIKFQWPKTASTAKESICRYDFITLTWRSNLEGCRNICPLNWLLYDFGPDNMVLDIRPLIILKNVVSQICFRAIFEINTASGACLLYASRAVLISNMLHQDHMWNQHCSRIIDRPYYRAKITPKLLIVGPSIMTGFLWKLSGATTSVTVTRTLAGAETDS